MCNLQFYLGLVVHRVCGQVKHPAPAAPSRNLHLPLPSSSPSLDTLASTKEQVDEQQLAFGRPPSLLPFDTLLLPDPVTPAWRRRLAEAHSARYVEASTALVGSHEAFLDENRTRDAAHPEGSDRRTGKHEEIGTEYDGRAGARRHGTTGTGGDGRARLKIGFIGHDFDEHPTAHMIEGVFVWQKRLSGIRQHGTGAADHLMSGAPRTKDLTASMVETDCCR